MTPPRKALIAVTSAHAPLYPDGKETGLFITEALHLFSVFQQAGFSVDLVSETARHPASYGLFFASAGHASLIDYPNATGLQRLAADVYVQGGVISAVCHGGAMFPRIRDAATGKSVIAGKRVTGFTTKGEEEEGVLNKIKSWGRSRPVGCVYGDGWPDRDGGESGECAGDGGEGGGAFEML